METLIQEEDAQPLTEPIIAPVRKNKFQHVENELPNTTYDPEFMADLMDNANLVRIHIVLQIGIATVLFIRFEAM